MDANEILKNMIAAFPLVLLAFFQEGPHAAPSDSVKTLVDNERVLVTDVTFVKGKPAPAQLHQFDSVTVFLVGGPVKITHADGKSHVVNRKIREAVFEPKGAISSEEGNSGSQAARAIVIDLKDGAFPPPVNKSPYPNAFPRVGSKKVFENDRVIVWDYAWKPGEPTPMHYHDKDVVVTYFEEGALKSTEPEGKATINEYKFGTVRYNPRDRSHSELLIRGTEHAVMTEFK